MTTAAPPPHGYRQFPQEQQQQTAPRDDKPKGGVFEPADDAPPPTRDIDAELTVKCGPAYYVTENGAIVINESHFVQRICRENLVLFEYA
jgi:hypothetical protein